MNNLFNIYDASFGTWISEVMSQASWWTFIFRWFYAIVLLLLYLNAMLHIDTHTLSLLSLSELSMLWIIIEILCIYEDFAISFAIQDLTQGYTWFTLK